MNVALPADLADVDVADLKDEDLRDAFNARFRRVEDLHRQCRPHNEALERIIARMGMGQLVGHCSDCDRPLFEHDEKRSYTADGALVCLPACPITDAAQAQPVVATGNVTLFTHRFAKVRK